MNDERDTERRVAMTPLQKAYCIGRLPELPLGGIECVAYFEFCGRRLDLGRLQQAVDHVHRHPALRCVFHLDHDGFLTDGQLPAPVVGLIDVAADAASERDAIRARMMQQTIDIGLGRNWAVELSTGPGAEHVLHVAFSLAAVDVAAIGLLLDELAAAYRGVPEQSDCRVPRRIAEVRDLVAAVTRPQRSGSPMRRSESAALLPGPDIASMTEDVTDDARMITFRRNLSASTWTALEGRADMLGVSTAALVLTVYENALRRWSDRPDFCVTVAGLDTRGSEPVITDRTTALAHRSSAAADFEQQVRASAKDLRQRMVERRDALSEVRDAQSAGDSIQLSRYVFTYGVGTEVYSPRVREVFGTPRSWGQTPQSAIDCRLLRVDEDTVEAAFDVRRAAVSEDTASAIFELFVQNLTEVAAGRPPVAVPRRQAELRDRLNATPPADHRLLYDAFRALAASRPDAGAVEESGPTGCPGREGLQDREAGVISYRDLDRRALAFAGRIAARTPPGSVVAVQLPRGIDQVVAVLGTLYAGCVYLPLGLEAPVARVQRIRERSRWALHVTPEFMAAEDPATPLRRPVDRGPDDLAYIIFTSGSTGEPKGVAITHGSASNTVSDVNHRHRVGPSDVVVGVSGIDFDLSVYDIFGTLSAGALLVTVGDSQTRDPFRWGEIIKHSGGTVWNSVPMLLEMLEAANTELPSVRLFLVSGDWIPLDLSARAGTLSPGSEFVAMGGATEASIWSNEYVITRPDDVLPNWPSIPYGRPLSGQQYRVVDQDGHDRPDGCVGELLIGGAGVAQGYYRDPARTEAAFSSGRDGSRWYRTGDLGYWHDGLIFFAGRRDNQVKIRGHRVECGEIEARLTARRDVAAAAVVSIRDRSSLGAVYVSAPHGPVSADAALEEQLRAELPWYMVPSVLRAVPELPMTPNGKVDRDAVVGLLQENVTEQTTDLPVTDTIFTTVTDAWARSLGRPVAADSNYFALGATRSPRPRCAPSSGPPACPSISGSFSVRRLSHSSSMPAEPATPGKPNRRRRVRAEDQRRNAPVRPPR